MFLCLHDQSNNMKKAIVKDEKEETRFVLYFEPQKKKKKNLRTVKAPPTVRVHDRALVKTISILFTMRFWLLTEKKNCSEAFISQKKCFFSYYFFLLSLLLFYW